ncbi:hypothetical protein [Psychrobacillus glaciei]|uniref:hypothetical protein n=1 Tax=Psychrobacillus glaciei TaxID=2283160 RepID=UPI00178C7A58|nr:hypothetical protein [Psychrobacillus glaciei]
MLSICTAMWLCPELVKLDSMYQQKTGNLRIISFGTSSQKMVVGGNLKIVSTHQNNLLKWERRFGLHLLPNEMRI